MSCSPSDLRGRPPVTAIVHPGDRIPDLRLSTHPAVRNSHPHAPVMLLRTSKLCPFGLLIAGCRKRCNYTSEASERRLDDLLADQEVSKLFAFLPLLNSSYPAMCKKC